MQYKENRINQDCLHWASLVAQMVKNQPAMWETCWEDPLEEGMATHSWKISMGSRAWLAAVHEVAKESDMAE